MNKKNTFVLTAVAFLTLGLVACEPDSGSSQDRGQRSQENTMQRALDSQPTYQPQYFLTREQVNKWMERQDVPNQLSYVYIMNDLGGIVGYYVAQSRPICTNTFLTPPERLVSTGTGNRAMATLPAPALDGVYYGNGPCHQQFFFDAETDAMIEVTGLNIMTVDQPLNIDAPELTVQVSSTSNND